MLIILRGVIKLECFELKDCDCLVNNIDWLWILFFFFYIFECGIKDCVFLNLSVEKDVLIVNDWVIIIYKWNLFDEKCYMFLCCYVLC